MKNILFIIFLSIFNIQNLFPQQIDTLWNYSFKNNNLNNLTFSNSSNYFFDSYSGYIFKKDENKYNYKELEFDVIDFKIRNELLLRYDTNAYMISTYNCANDQYNEFDVSFLKDYSFDELNYFDNEILILQSKVYDRAKVFDLKTKEMVAEFANYNNAECQKVLKIPNSKSVIGIQYNQCFEYSLNSNQIIRRFDIPISFSELSDVDFVNDSVLSLQSDSSICFYNIKNNKFNLLQLNTNKNYSLKRKVSGDNNAFVFSEDYQYYIYDFEKNTKHLLEAGIIKDFLNISIDLDDTLYFYQQKIEVDKKKFQLLFSIDYYKKNFDTIFFELSQDTLFVDGKPNIIFPTSRVISYNNKRFYDLNTGKYLNEFPLKNNFYASRDYNENQILLYKSIKKQDDTISYLFNARTGSLDSLPDNEVLPPKYFYSSKYHIATLGTNKVIFDTNTGDSLYAGQSLNISRYGNMFVELRNTKIIGSDNYEYSYNFIKIDDRRNMFEYFFVDTVSKSDRYAQSYSVSPDTSFIVFIDSKYLKIFDISKGLIIDSIVKSEDFLSSYFSDNNRYFQTVNFENKLISFYSIVEDLSLLFEFHYEGTILTYDMDYALINSVKNVTYAVKLNYNTSSIEEIFDFVQQDKMSIYPNPASQDININAESYINKIEIYSVSGELIKVYDNISSTNARLELETLQTGAYLIRAFFDGFTYSKKFVKE